MKYIFQEQCLDMTGSRFKRRAGIRFTFLLRQLSEAGKSQTEIADAIGCHQTLISKWWWRGEISPELIQKGLRDDVIQGITDGLGYRSDLLFMPRPKNYHGRIKLPNGETRPAEPEELDASEFRLVTNEEFQTARDRKEVAGIKAEIEDLRETVEANSRQLAQLLAILAVEHKTK